MIKFVYFDVGGVLIRDFSKSNKWNDLAREIGILEEKEKDFLNFWKSYEQKVSTGLNVDLLVPIIKKEFSSNFPKNYSLLKDGFVSRFDQNKTIWPLVKELKKTYKVGLLTNQYPDMFNLVNKNELLPDISWDVIIDSTIVKVRKPQPEIYKLAEKEAGYSGDEIFFIDNLQEHIDGAKKFGWQTFLYDPADTQKSTQELADKLKISF